MIPQLLIFKNHIQSHVFDLTQKQLKKILNTVDYSPEQYKVLNKITSLDENYFNNPEVDYYVIY